jgi:hypothetical protein
MNRHLILSSLALLAAILTPALPAGGQLGVRPPILARATLIDDRKLTIELIGRNKGLVSFREAGKTMETDLKPAAFKWIEFNTNLDTNAINTLYQKEDYAAAAKQLNTALSPLLPYLDLPSELPPLTRTLLKCLYRTGRFSDTITLSNVIAASVPDQTMKFEAKLYKVLALTGRNDRLDATLLLKSLGNIHKTNTAAAAYYFATAQLHLSYTNWAGAQEFSSRVVAFTPRDEDWMAPALLLSAQCYAHFGQYAVAEQTLRELSLVFNKTSWPAIAKPLQEEYKRLHEEQQTNKPQDALPEERGKSATKNLLK